MKDFYQPIGVKHSRKRKKELKAAKKLLEAIKFRPFNLAPSNEKIESDFRFFGSLKNRNRP